MLCTICCTCQTIRQCIRRCVNNWNEGLSCFHSEAQIFIRAGCCSALVMSDPIWGWLSFDVHELCAQHPSDVPPAEGKAVVKILLCSKSEISVKLGKPHQDYCRSSCMQIPPPPPPPYHSSKLSSWLPLKRMVLLVNVEPILPEFQIVYFPDIFFLFLFRFSRNTTMQL